MGRIRALGCACCGGTSTCIGDGFSVGVARIPSPIIQESPNECQPDLPISSLSMSDFRNLFLKAYVNEALEPTCQPFRGEYLLEVSSFEYPDIVLTRKRLGSRQMTIRAQFVNDTEVLIDSVFIAAGGLTATYNRIVGSNPPVLFGFVQCDACFFPVFDRWIRPPRMYQSLAQAQSATVTVTSTGPFGTLSQACNFNGGTAFDDWIYGVTFSGISGPPGFQTSASVTAAPVVGNIIRGNALFGPTIGHGEVPSCDDWGEHGANMNYSIVPPDAYQQQGFSTQPANMTIIES